MFLSPGSRNYELLRNWLWWCYVVVENLGSGSRWQDLNLTHYLGDCGQVTCQLPFHNMVSRLYYFED